MTLDDELNKDSYIQKKVDLKVHIATNVRPAANRWYQSDRTFGYGMVFFGAGLEALAIYQTIADKSFNLLHLAGSWGVLTGIYIIKSGKKSHEKRQKFLTDLTRED